MPDPAPQDSAPQDGQAGASPAQVLPPPRPAAGARPPTATAAGAQSGRKLPSTDAGTVALHWLAAAAMAASLATGLRVSSDALHAPIAGTLSPILPDGEVWTVHFASGLVLFFCVTAYALYLARSGLWARNGTLKLRALRAAAALPAPAARRQRWGAVAVLLHWALYALVAVLAATGVLLFLGHGGWVVRVHTVGALCLLGYVLLHVLAHLLQGGWQQLLRVFRPAALAAPAGARPRPFLVAALVGIPVAGGLGGLELATRDTLRAPRVEGAPTLDGSLEDAVWRRARPVAIRTAQGANLGGSGESVVEVRAVHDGSRIHFAFRWQDPSRSLRRNPLVKRADGWHLVHDRADVYDETAYYEDKLAVVFSQSDAFGGGGVAHLGPRPLGDRPAAINGRGLHYTTDGGVADLWHWKPVRGGLLGHVDDNYFGPPTEPAAAEAAGTARYTGGYRPDPGRPNYANNFKTEPRGGYRGPVAVLRLPRDPAATAAAMGRFDADPDAGAEDGSRWWMTEDETVPYSAEADAAIPVGTVIPGVLIQGAYAGDRADVRGAARWADGHWTLEASRALRTGSPYDQEFAPGRPLHMWVAVFDHAQTRHTRHPRPVRLQLD